MRCYIEKIENVKIENYNHHDGEQLLFLKNFKNNKKKSTYQNTERKEGCSWNLYIIAL